MMIGHMAMTLMQSHGIFNNRYINVCMCADRYIVIIGVCSHIDIHVLVILLTQEFALKACIEHFNNTYYNQDGMSTEANSSQAPPPPTAPGGGATAATNPPQPSSEGGEASQLTPLDCNYLSVLGKQVCVCVCVWGGGVHVYACA